LEDSRFEWSSFRGAGQQAPRLPYETLRLLLAVGTVVLAATSCGTSNCHDLVILYANELANAAACDPTAANTCSVKLPIVYGLEETDGGFAPEGLASNCNGAFNAPRATHLEALYAQFRAKGCREAEVPLCGIGSVGECDQLPPGLTGPTGYACVLR